MFLKEFFEKVNFEKKSADDKKIMKNYPACKEVFLILSHSAGNGTKRKHYLAIQNDSRLFYKKDSPWGGDMLMPP